MLQRRGNFHCLLIRFHCLIDHGLHNSEETGRSPFRYAFDVFTMTIGNVNVSKLN